MAKDDDENQIQGEYEGYSFGCVSLTTVMRFIWFLVICGTILSMVNFFISVSAKHPDQSLGAAFAMIFSIVTGVAFSIACWVDTKNVKYRTVLKWSTLFMMAANFIYGADYISQYLYPTNEIFY